MYFWDEIESVKNFLFVEMINMVIVEFLLLIKWCVVLNIVYLCLEF